MPDDEQYDQACENIADALGRYGFSDDNLRAFEVDDLSYDLIAAVRAALQPAVPPLGPGEVVTIPDTGDPDQCIVARLSAGGLLVTGFACLDAAGVRALQTACQRFLAAQESDDDGE